MNDNILAISLSLCMMSSVALAGPHGGPSGENEGPRRAPQVAIDACASAAAEAACSFTGRRGETVEGQCLLPPVEADDTLVCVPERHLKRRAQAAEDR